METFTVNQVAEVFHVHRDTVVYWIRSAELSAINIARKKDGMPRYRITDEALKNFRLRRGAVEGPPPPRPRHQKTKLPDGWVDVFAKP
ncbi:MAG: helix-turn-helix domain-containing protein [Pirellulales bacterium]|nr:helix-turn-helix domain-containing protein [Pirellulales bacterium]